MTHHGQVTSSWAIARCRDRLARLADACPDPVSFRQETINALRPVIGFDGWCWSSTDPLTGVPTAGIAGNPALAGAQRRLFELEYSTGVSDYRDPARGMGVARLLAATGGNPGRCRRWAELLGPRGVGDELRVTLAERGERWGHLVLWRAWPPGRLGSRRGCRARRTAARPPAQGGGLLGAGRSPARLAAPRQAR